MFTRREILKITGMSCAGVLTGSMKFPSLFADGMIQRLIPSTNEKLPVIGLGTWQTFDVGSSESERQPLKDVLTTMRSIGGRVIDSSPMYGNSEEVVGDLTVMTGTAESFFYATKVWTSGKDEGKIQMMESMKKLRRSVIDLMQIHNVLDWKTHLPVLREWKDAGKIRYIGITHYTASAYSELEKILKSEPVDFVQFNYSLGERDAERSLLQTAQDRGVAVLINRPFAGGSLFQAAKNKPLPQWASELGITSWGQYFLKYIISHPAVTCAIAGTSKPQHLKDNMMAAFGKLPDQVVRKKMSEYFDSL
ncbi:aldo/keto reductase [bacterium]|nr:aldo/keto reductase [bacterium]